MDRPIKHVLFADDDVAWHDILRRRFSAAGARDDCPYSFEVETVSSAAEGIERIRSRAASKTGPYAVVVLDIRMEERESGLSVGSSPT